jgi:hypothetical protein
MKPFVNSGHAFVCFDSVNSLNVINKHFRLTPTQHFKIFLIGIKDKFNGLVDWITGRDAASQHQLFDSRGRSRSNFLRNTEQANIISSNYNDRQNILVVRKASEPMDILWKNMGLIKSHFAFVRLFLFIIGLILIVFLSSPAVMLTRLQKVDPTQFLSFDWAYNFGWLGPYLHKSMPPFFILCINLMVINLLDMASVYEKYDSHS